MKQKDIALILIIVFVSGIFSYVVASNFISPVKKDQTAAKVEPITSDFTQPSEKYFNEQSINPTQLIQIETNANPSPVR